MKKQEWLIAIFAGLVFIVIFIVMANIGSETMHIEGIVMEKPNLTESGPFMIIHNYDWNVTYNVTSMSIYSKYNVGDYVSKSVPRTMVSYTGDIHEIPPLGKIIIGGMLIVIWILLVLFLLLSVRDVTKSDSTGGE